MRQCESIQLRLRRGPYLQEAYDTAGGMACIRTMCGMRRGDRSAELGPSGCLSLAVPRPPSLGMRGVQVWSCWETRTWLILSVKWGECSFPPLWHLSILWDLLSNKLLDIFGCGVAVEMQSNVFPIIICCSLWNDSVVVLGGFWLLKTVPYIFLHCQS